jgi:hypothetical protein
MGEGGQRHDLAALPQGKRSITDCTGSWVGPRAALEGCGKFPSTGIRSPDVQPVASRYTDPHSKHWALTNNVFA